MCFFSSTTQLLILHITSCLGLKENEQEAIKEDEKEYKPSRVWRNYFLNAWHPDAKMNNGCARVQEAGVWPGVDRDGMNKAPVSSFKS